MMQKFELKLHRRNIPESELIDDLRAVASKLALPTITKEHYDSEGRFGATTFLRRFGSWNTALHAAGFRANNRLDISNDELFENLAYVWSLLGRQPFGSNMQKQHGKSKFSLGTYEKRFGSWNKALIAFIENVNGKEIQTNSSIQSVEIANSTSVKSHVRTVNWRLRATVLIRDNCICKMCGASPSKNSQVVLHVDHILPWSKGGPTVLENLQTLCETCNIGKSNVIFE